MVFLNGFSAKFILKHLKVSNTPADMVERYENVNLNLDVGPSPFERASSHGALPRTSSVEQTAPEGPVATHSGELARRRLPGHKRASSLSDLSR